MRRSVGARDGGARRRRREGGGDGCDGYGEEEEEEEGDESMHFLRAFFVFPVKNNGAVCCGFRVCWGRFLGV